MVSKQRELAFCMWDENKRQALKPWAERSSAVRKLLLTMRSAAGTTPIIDSVCITMEG